MKRIYASPSLKIETFEIHQALLDNSPGLGAYTDDPQKPGDALVHERNGSWEEGLWSENGADEEDDLWEPFSHTDNNKY